MDSQPSCVRDKIQLYETSQVQIITTAHDEIVEDCIHLENMELASTENSAKKRKSDQRSDDSLEEGWTISRRRKAGRKMELEIENEGTVQVCVTSQQVLPKQFALARLFKEQSIDKISRVKYVTSSKMLVSFEDQASADRFVEAKAFEEIGWRCYKTSEVGVSYGVIRNIEIELTEQDLLINLSCSSQVISAKRLNKRNHEADGEAWIPSEVIRLGFKGALVPSYVFIYGMRVKVDTYTFPVTQCAKCWSFGHVSKFCPMKKIVCPKCAEKHDNCESTAFKCVNCSGSHMAMSKSCPLFKKEKRIREIMSESNTTYRKAVLMYTPLIPVSQRLDRPPYLQEEDNIIVKPLSAPVESDIERENRPLYSEVARKTKVKNQHPVKKAQEQHEIAGHLEKNKSSTLDAAKSRNKKKRQPNHMPNQSSSDEDIQESTTSPKNIEINKSSFSKLITKFKDILFNSESFDSKIEVLIKMFMEWIIPKVVSSLLSRSPLNTDQNG